MQSRLLERQARNSFSQRQSFRPPLRSDSAEKFISFAAEKFLLPTPLHLQNIPPPALVDAATDVVEVPLSTSSTVLQPVLRIVALETTHYKADVSSADRPGQAAVLTDPDHFEKKCSSRSVRAAWLVISAHFRWPRKPSLRSSRSSPSRCLRHACGTPLPLRWLPLPCN